MADFLRSGTIRARLSALMRHDQVVLSVLAVLVGGAAAYGSIAFREFADLVALFVYGAAEEQIPAMVRGMPGWQVVALPAAGGLVLGLLTRYVLPGPMPQAVSDVIEASALRNGRMRMRHGWAAAFLSASSIGVGASVGREGPIVHLGAALASQVAQRLHLSASLSRTVLGCGVASAVAAAFNAPIAGVFFALEVVVGHYGLGAFSPVVIASVIGTVVTRVHIGDNPAFALLPQHVTSFWEVPAFLLLGVVCAFVSILFMRGIVLVERIHRRIRTPDWLQPALGGALLGAMALQFPQILGVGYEITTSALKGEVGFELLVMLALAKLAGSALCLGSRFGGGVFSPSLAIGALAGGAFGIVAASVFPELGSAPSVYAVLGMGAVAASTLGAPISTVMIIFELTTDYGITFALMASVAIASVITRQVYGESFFHEQLKARGVAIDNHREMSLLRTRRVVDVMRRGQVVVPGEAGLEELKARFCASHAPIFVADENGRFYGTISFEDLADAAFGADGAQEEPVTARTLARRQRVVLVPGDDLASALNRCQSYQEDFIPVVRDRDDQVIVGEVRYTDLIQAYNHALLEARAIEQGRRWAESREGRY